MKTVLFLALAAALILGLSACEGPSTEHTDPDSSSSMSGIGNGN